MLSFRVFSNNTHLIHTGAIHQDATSGTANNRGGGNRKHEEKTTTSSSCPTTQVGQVSSTVQPGSECQVTPQFKGTEPCYLQNGVRHKR